MSKKSKIISIAVTAVVLLALAAGYLYWTGALDKFLPRKAFVLEEYKATDTVRTEPEEYVPDLMLVNKQFTLSADYEPDIVFYRDTDVPMGRAVVDAYGELSDYVRNNMNDRLFVSSTYRSFDDQQRVYDEEGSEIAALPGESEHQTGLAIDVYVKNFAGKGFIQSKVGMYVNKYCHEYGFIIRYPEGREDVTGFEYEPWHIRYVGHPHAEIIAEYDLTLEEYLGYFTAGKWYRYDEYVIGMCSEGDIKIPAAMDQDSVKYSKDNRGNVFVWGKIA